MHPGQRCRLRHEEAERTGEDFDVCRHGRKIATLSLGAPQGTRRVRPWNVTMVDGSDVPGPFFKIEAASRAAINCAIKAAKA